MARLTVIDVVDGYHRMRAAARRCYEEAAVGLRSRPKGVGTSCLTCNDRSRCGRVR